ncbi:hypothetical protein P8C59_001433 [Phyllachora maydis]|uniref:Pyridoxamine 5'-phosphate oxidase Alr4036 family FMN-binding domain-containing protein n=1 Tax=Phyllachora maydis TaxID=1825666 RepID=A0AAD9HZ99_9PEZI|nr:hypothetical protein P8C59_001433 [Phyllachora maydis]
MSAPQQAHSGPSTPAPWRDLFLQHMATMPQPTFTLATLHPVPASAAPAAGLAVVPRARTCIFRGTWGTLPDNKHNTAPRNAPTYESDLPVFTTDARMDKTAEILDTAGTPAGAMVGMGPLTGGGGPVEAVFWPAEARTQWRVRGTAWVLGPDVEAEGGRAGREALMSRMRRVEGQDGEVEVEGQGQGQGKPWSWATEVTGHFGNLSPAMRGSFRNPPPGTPVAIPAAKGQGLGQKVDHLHDELARSHFRVVVIVPTEVDQADLSDPENPKRWLYIYRARMGEWEKVAVWP